MSTATLNAGSVSVVDIDGEFDNLSASFRVLGAVAAEDENPTMGVLERNTEVIGAVG
jgi:hypothetical protein